MPVVINHFGKPRGDRSGISEDEMKVWREGMRRMAKFRHVFVKLSMMGYAVPGWTADSEKEELVKQVCCPPSVDPPAPIHVLSPLR